MDPEGFDPEADTVGAGIYGGNIELCEDGSPVIKAPQYQEHNPRPGPVYTGTGYTDMSKAISRGDLERIKELCSNDSLLVNQLSTGGALPLHMCGMSENGQKATQTLIDLGGDISAADTWGYQPIHRMASNNLEDGLQTLVLAGADIRATIPALPPFQGGDTPLSIAVSSRAFRVIKMLLKHGITEEELAKFGIRLKA